MKTLLCAIAKNENRYIREWVEHYRYIGITKIIIYDNNDNERFDDVILDYISMGFVEVIDIRNDGLSRIGYQNGVMKHCFENYGKDYDWFCHFDIDEFFTATDSLESFLSLDVFNDTSVIHINWQCYGDNDLVFYDSRPVQERFKLPADENCRYAQDWRENLYCKCFIRTSAEITSFNPHCPISKNGICRHSSGRISRFENYLEEPDYSKARIKHYSTKTIEEYIWRKLKNVTNISSAQKSNIIKRIEWFFNMNKKTDEKLKVIKNSLTLLY